MNKVIFTVFVLLAISGAAISQGRTEHIDINWPGEYNWKTVRQTHHDNVQTLMIIPGSDSVSNASIIGSLTVFRGAKFSNIAEVIQNYRGRLDTGSTLTPLDK